MTLVLASLTGIFILMGLGFSIWRHRMREIRSLRLGRLTLLVWGSALLGLNFLVWTLAYSNIAHLHWILWVGAVELILAFIVSFVLGLTVPIMIIVLTVQMMRRETWSLANLLLPAVVFTFLIFDIAYSWAVYGIGKLPPSYTWLMVLSWIFPVLITYLAWQLLVFFVASVVYGHRVKNETANVFVVHGAGLVGGQKVGRLLAARIEAAVTASNEETTFVMSGGKGDDEHLSEAEAMRNYAVEMLKIPESRIILEDQSKTTYENLVNSAKLIHEKFLFFSSDFHVFRAALFAASLKLDAQGGKGGKTRFYYRIPAFLREFVAVMNSERKRHIIWVAVIVLFFGLLALGAANIFHGVKS